MVEGMTNITKSFFNEQARREIAIWLSGLLSTDGTITKSKKWDAYSFDVTTKEIMWAVLIQTKLYSIGIKASIPERPYKTPKGDDFYIIHLMNPRQITLFLVENNCEEFFNPRKWKIVLEAYDIYKKIQGSHWTPIEVEFLKDHLNLSRKELALKLGRTKDAVNNKLYRLRGGR